MATSSLPTLLTILLLPLMAGCTFDYDEATVETEGQPGVPQTEVIDVRMVVVRENRLELTARRIATFPDEGVQEFEEMTFQEFGPQGDLRLAGSAEGGTLHLDSEDVELRGEVRLTSTEDDAVLESDFLYWDNAGRILSSRDGGVVSVGRGDGSRISGAGLRLDGRRNVVEFENGVQGTYVSEEEE